MALPPVLSSIVSWLRAGYPEGVPERDYIPLFALLSRELSEEQVNRIAEELAGSSDPLSARAIHEAAGAVISHQMLDSDVARVSARLEAGGRPPAAPAS